MCFLIEKTACYCRTYVLYAFHNSLNYHLSQRTKHFLFPQKMKIPKAPLKKLIATTTQCLKSRSKNIFASNRTCSLRPEEFKKLTRHPAGVPHESSPKVCVHAKLQKLCPSCRFGKSPKCIHERTQYRCNDCRSGLLQLPPQKNLKCEHGRCRYMCKECGTAAICVHRQWKNRCRICQYDKNSPPTLDICSK